MPTPPAIYPCALFADLRRRSVDRWEYRNFTIAYLVAGNPAATRELCAAWATHLATTPHVTIEVTDRVTLPFLLDQDWITRLSLPHDWIDDTVKQSGKALDAVIRWDHRRRAGHFIEQIDTMLAQGVRHLSLYGLQDFALWQAVRHHLRGQGMDFYERFHAATNGCDSPYQTHIAACGDVIALHGWSRLTDNGTTRVKGPGTTHWTTLDAPAAREERLLLGLTHRDGVPASTFTSRQIAAATRAGLATCDGDRLQPTDLGLWQTTRLVALLS